MRAVGVLASSSEVRVCGVAGWGLETNVSHGFVRRRSCKSTCAYVCIGVDGARTFGGVFSSTVSSIGLGPLGPLLEGLTVVAGCNWSSLCTSVLFVTSPDIGFGGGVDDVGVDVWTRMLGAVTPRWLKLESLRDLAAAGGGDLSRGDCGQTGVVSPEVTTGLGCIFGSLETASVTGPAG